MRYCIGFWVVRPVTDSPPTVTFGTAGAAGLPSSTTRVAWIVSPPSWPVIWIRDPATDSLALSASEISHLSTSYSCTLPSVTAIETYLSTALKSVPGATRLTVGSSFAIARISTRASTSRPSAIPLTVTTPAWLTSTEDQVTGRFSRLPSL